MKKILNYVFVLLLITTLVGCNKGRLETSFDKYMDDLFVVLLGSDPYDVNSTLLYPEKLGIEKSKVTPYTLDEKEEQEYFKYLKNIRAKVASYKDSSITKEQQLTKKIVLDYLDRQLAFEGLFYYGSYLGSYLGYQAQLPVILAEYRFDDMDDIEDYFKYLTITIDNFKAIVTFEQEKIKRNMGLTNPIIQKVIEQCQNFIGSEEIFLIDVFNEKVDALSFLSSSRKEELKELHQAYVLEDFVGAYSYLAGELQKMKGTATHNGALANFPEGKRYYEALFRRATGTNMTVLEAKAYLEDTIDRVMRNAKPAYDTEYATNLMAGKTRNTVMDFIQMNMAKDFPALSVEVEYSIKEISDSMKDNSSPAMYFISPIDANVPEVIYINPLNFAEDNNYVYQTLAHEGYPGHLYQNVYLKTSDIPNVRKILHYTGYAEGWSTYVENYVVGYVKPSAKAAFEYYDSLTYLFLGLLDIGINYEGWSMNEAFEFMRANFVGITREVSDELFYDLTEIPTNYLQYYFSYYQVQDLKDKFRVKMAADYSDLLFHTIYLETGPAPFWIIEEQLMNYKR